MLFLNIINNNIFTVSLISIAAMAQCPYSTSYNPTLCIFTYVSIIYMSCHYRFTYLHSSTLPTQWATAFEQSTVYLDPRVLALLSIW